MLSRLVVVDKEHVGLRLDFFLTRHFLPPLRIGGLSRSGIQKMIAGGQVTLNGRKPKSGVRLKSSDLIEIQWLPTQGTALIPEALPLDILHEDEDCIVINKAPGIAVHPAAGRRNGTLVNALLYHCPNLPGIGGERRPGIVHRLDKDTSGVMVIAKNDQASRHIALQFKRRQVHKEYLALVWGRMDKERGMIDRPIGRHRGDRKRMSSIFCLSRSREAKTEWQVEESFAVGPLGNRLSWITLLRLKPLSGRTHQIRVHLADEGYPVVGDRTYGRRQSAVDRSYEKLPGLTDFSRQALHAERLRFCHPGSGVVLQFYAPLAPDMQRLLDFLRERPRSGEWTKIAKGC
jgi:23S rRNA pseudouridine1911/1915/1917 synthase